MDYQDIVNKATRHLNAVAQQVIDLSDIGIILLDNKERVCCWNKWMVDKSNVQQENAVGLKLEEIFTSLSSLRLKNAIDDAYHCNMSSILSPKFNPHILPLFLEGSTLTNPQPMGQMLMIKPIIEEVTYCLIQVIDVSSAIARDQMLRAHAANSKSKELHTRTILSSIADAVVTTNEKGIIDYMNNIAEKLTGWQFSEAINQPLEAIYQVVDSHTNNKFPKATNFINSGDIPKSTGNNLLLTKKCGSPIAIEESLAAIKNTQQEVKGLVIVFRDVSHSRELVEQVNWQATHDALTGLYNRTEFDHKLSDLVERAKELNEHHTLLYLDLDQFKIVNDTCGHVAGDELLKQVSNTILSQIRTNDILARLGGDEFGILLQNCPLAIATNIANNIRQSIKDFRFGWGENSFQIGVSIGLVEIDNESIDLKQLLSAADAACYAAKDNGRNQVHVYDKEASDAADRHGEMQWFSRIQQALEENRFCLYGQVIAPVLAPDKVEHIEVLIRMLDENFNILPPGAFIPAAERFNLMSAIDRWVVKNVFTLIKDNRDKIIKENMHFAINLSGNTLSDKETLLYIIDLLTRFDIPRERISFEITETSAIANLSAATNFINALKSQGCRFSLDDFGSGLSSFAYLKAMPVDFLKIDGAFIKDIVKDPIDREMVKSINQIGHVMNLQTIAEFVENDETLAVLKEIGVDHAQGYGISKPTPLTDEKGRLVL